MAVRGTNDRRRGLCRQSQRGQFQPFVCSVEIHQFAEVSVGPPIAGPFRGVRNGLSALSQNMVTAVIAVERDATQAAVGPLTLLPSPQRWGYSVTSLG